MDVLFRTATGLKINLNLEPSDTVTMAKQLLSEKTGANINSITLFYKTYQLRDDLVFGDLDLTEDSIIGIRVHKRSIIKNLDDDNQNLLNLIQLGFSRENSIAALISSNDNLEQALEILCNQVEQDQPQQQEQIQPTPQRSDYSDYYDPIDRLVAFSGFDRSIVISVYENFHQNEQETQNYLQQLRE